MGEDEAGDGSGAASTKRGSCSAYCRAGGADVIDQQDARAAPIILRAKCAVHVRLTRHPVERRLLSRCSNAAERVGSIGELKCA